MDLVNIGPDVAKEKDDLLEKVSHHVLATATLAREECMQTLRMMIAQSTIFAQFVEWSASVCSSLEK